MANLVNQLVPEIGTLVDVVRFALIGDDTAADCPMPDVYQVASEMTFRMVDGKEHRSVVIRNDGDEDYTLYLDLDEWRYA